MFWASIVQDRDLSEYDPSRSSTSKPLSCSHQLCQLGLNCQSPNGSCPYSVNYYSEDTSSSGLLFEDQLHLTSSGGGAHEGSIHAQVIIGYVSFVYSQFCSLTCTVNLTGKVFAFLTNCRCGSKQSGSYLDGSAPDGLLGLGPGKISIPSLLARSGLVPHSFSYCFDNSYSGRMYFGDQGPATQRSTTFVPYKGE